MSPFHTFRKNQQSDQETSFAGISSNKNMRKRFVAPLLVTALFQSVGAQDLRPSVAEQIKIGQDAAKQIRKEEKVLPDSDPRVKYIREMGPKLVALIPEAERKKRPFQYSFDVIDSKEINAFALPGGPIFFYTGLINLMSTSDQFVGVLGHEITHVRNQHWASAYADNMKRRLGLAVLLTIINANGSITNAADIIDQGLFLLPYSRKHESESDKFGYDLVMKLGMNPQGMADVFRKLAAGKGKDGFGDVLSTHPDPLKRAEAIEKRLKAEKTAPPAQKPLPFQTDAMKPKPVSSLTFLEILALRDF